MGDGNGRAVRPAPLASLRKQQRAGPLTAGALEDDALVKAGDIAGPELDGRGDHAVAAPERRPGHDRAGKARLNRLDLLVEPRARGERLALPRRPRADLRAARPRREIRIRLGV